MARAQKIQHIRGNNLTAAGSGIVVAPGASALLPGELAMNYNSVDPTLFIGTVVNNSATNSDINVATSAVAQFKSLAWLQNNVLGTTNPAQVKTLKYITDTLDLLVQDADAVVNTWGEIKSFLSTIPSDSGYDIMSLFNGKASVELKIMTSTAASGTTPGSITEVAKLYDDISIKTTTVAANGGVPAYAKLYVNTATITPNVNTGVWVDSTWVAPVYSDTTSIDKRAPNALEVRNFLNLFNRMFTLTGDGGSTPYAIRANYGLFSTGGVSSLGQNTEGGGGGGGLIATVLDSTGLGGTYLDTDKTNTFNAYSINKIYSDLLTAVGRISTLEGGSATGINVTGTGNAITGVTKAGTTITFTKDSTFVLTNDSRLSDARKNPYLLTFTGYSTATYDGSGAVSVALPTKVSQLSNDSNFLTAITKSQVEAVLTGAITTHTHSQYLTANQTVTLTGDVTGSGATSITTSLAATVVTGKALTNYVIAGAEAAIAATDTILAAFGKLQLAINNRPVEGNTGITTVGTITTGTWSGSTIGVTKGGTGLTSIAANSMLYASGANTLAVLATTAYGRGLLSATTDTLVSGLYAAKADKLATTRKLTVSGTGISSTGVDFDGSSNVAIAMSIDSLDGGSF